MAEIVNALKDSVNVTKGSNSMQHYIADVQRKFRSLVNSRMTLEALPFEILLENVKDEFPEVISALDTLDLVSIEKASTMLLNTESSQESFSKHRPIAAAVAAELNALRSQVEEMAGPKHPHKKFDGTPCSLHSPSSTHTDKQFYKKMANKCPVFLYPAPVALSTTENLMDIMFYIDSGAGLHMDFDRKRMTDYVKSNGPNIQLGDNSTITSCGSGTSLVNIRGGVGSLENVLHVKKLGKKLLSVGQSTSKGMKLWFSDDHCIIFGNQQCIKPSRNLENLYSMPSAELSSNTTSPISSSKLSSNFISANFSTRGSEAYLDLWHDRTGHLNSRDLARFSEGLAVEMSVKEVQVSKTEIYEPCLLPKMTRAPFRPSSTKTTRQSRLYTLILQDHSLYLGLFHIPYSS